MACQAHPALVKIGPVLVQFFIFDSLLAHIHVWQFDEDPTPLACDNIYTRNKPSLFGACTNLDLGYLTHTL